MRNDLSTLTRPRRCKARSRLPLAALAVLAPLLANARPALADGHPVFSLVDNRALAHQSRRGGLYIEAGAAGMAKYIHFSRPIAVWKLKQKEDGRRVALAQAVVSLEVPLDDAQAKNATTANKLWLSLKAPASTVKVTVNGKSSPAVMLKSGWQVVGVPLPANLTVGENLLRLNFANFGTYAGQKAAAAIESIQVGGSEPPGTAEANSSSVTLPRGGGASWYAWVPEGGSLSARGDGGGCDVHVRAETSGARGAGAVDTSLKLDGSSVDMSTLAKRFVRLTLTADGGACTQATLTQAALSAGGPPPQLAAKNPPKNVVVWLTDDTRADKYRFYNPKSRVETPVFDELMKSSSTFRVAYTQGNESRVSHASLWTSLYPGVHQMISEKAKLNPAFVTMAEAIRPSKRYCAGVMANGFIDKFWGFGDGWDAMRNNIHDLPAHGLSADAILADGLHMLDGLKQVDGSTKPFFLYLGTIDSHVSWRAHEPWISKYDGGNTGAYNPRFQKACTDPDEEQIVLGKLKITDRDKLRIQALYDSDVSYNDAVLGKLIDELKKRGLWDTTMLVLASDHGEELWDHGKVGHGQSIREELVHVPFLIHYPPYFPTRVVEEGVDVMDVLPTVVDALGLPAVDSFQGESLIPVAEGVSGGYPRPAIASQYELAHTMRLGRWKLWVGGSGDTHLWDAVSDAHEDHDLIDKSPIEKRALTDALGTWMAYRNQWKKKRWGVPSNLSAGFSSENDK